MASSNACLLFSFVCSLPCHTPRQHAPTNCSTALSTVKQAAPSWMRLHGPLSHLDGAGGPAPVLGRPLAAPGVECLEGGPLQVHQRLLDHRLVPAHMNEAHEAVGCQLVLCGIVSPLQQQNRWQASLYGQQQSHAVAPAVAAAMSPHRPARRSRCIMDSSGVPPTVHCVAGSCSSAGGKAAGRQPGKL